MAGKLPLSVSMISFNEEKNIARTLESVRDIAREIVVVDSHSTDRTREIAASLGALVYEEDWKGDAGQKNSSAEKCTEEWILMLDCDEVLSEELRQSVIQAITSGTHDGYEVNRRTHYLGRLLRYAWHPDWKLRLVKRSARPKWVGYNPHSYIEMTGTTGRLDGDMVHYSYRDVYHHFVKTLDHARIAAASYHEKGRRFRWSNLLFNPIVAFVRLYILRQGFRDGFQGLVAGFSTYVYTFLKYVFLREHEMNARR